METPNLWHDKKTKLLLKELYSWLDYEGTNEKIQNDIECGYLTHNVGLDDREYIWYLEYDSWDDRSIAIDILTGRILSDKEICEVMGI